MAAEEGKFIRTRRNQLDFPSRNSLSRLRGRSAESPGMASDGSLSVSVSTSPKHGNRDAETVTSSSPKGQCLCSPTVHQGSFRCRLHRSTSSAWMKRSKSMPANNPVASLSPKESHGSS